MFYPQIIISYCKENRKGYEIIDIEINAIEVALVKKRGEYYNEVGRVRNCPVPVGEWKRRFLK